MKTSHVILGIMGATAAGAILGVLFAPEKGSETRRKITQKSKDYTNGFKDKLNTISDAVSSSAENLVDGVKNTFNTIGSASEAKGTA